MCNNKTNTGEEIEKKSFRIIEQEIPEPRPFCGQKWQIVRRMIHASADLELMSLVRFQPQAIESGLRVLNQGGLILTDTQMVKAGITLSRINSLGCEVKCLLNDLEVSRIAKQKECTRSEAAVERAGFDLQDCIFVVGNAPTALEAVVRIYENKKLIPALVIGMCVGFVGAAEAKDKLMQSNLPSIAIKGRKGGSAVASACLNALAEIALSDSQDNVAT